MIKKFTLPVILTLAFVLICPIKGYPQDESTVYEPTAGNFFVVGARALAMGGAHIAVASDATALIYNPAGLARVSRIEFAGGLTHQSADNATSWQIIGQPYDGPSQNNTRFSSANIVMPVPTYRGSLVLALGVNRVHSFDRTMDYQYVPAVGSIETGAESESGGLYLWSLGGAIDVSPNVSVGAALNLWTGRDNYNWFKEVSVINHPESDYRYDDIIKARYSGLNAKLGVRIQPSRIFVIGGTIDTPVTLTIKEDVEQFTDTSETSYYEYFSDEYKVSLPFSLGAGFAFHLEHLTLA
jgi:hypothetical protein